MSGHQIAEKIAHNSVRPTFSLIDDPTLQELTIRVPIDVENSRFGRVCARKLQPTGGTPRLLISYLLQKIAREFLVFRYPLAKTLVVFAMDQ